MLSARQQRFVDEYVVDLNGSAAYRRAGYAAKGNSAEAAAARLLRNVKVRTAVDELLAKRSETTGVTAEWVVDRLKIEAKREGPGSSPSARVQALKLLGDHLAIFKERPSLDELLDGLNPATRKAIDRLLDEAVRAGGGTAGGQPNE